MLEAVDAAAEETGSEEASGLLETVSLDFVSSLCSGSLETAFEDSVTELFSSDCGSAELSSEDGTTEDSTETSEAGVIAWEAGKIGAFSPAELNEDEAGTAGVQPMKNTSKIKKETTFFISTLQKASVTV